MVLASRLRSWMSALGPAADDTARVGQQDTLDQDRRGVRRGTILVVARTSFKFREIQIVIDQVAQRVCTGAGQNLLGENHPQKAQTHVDHFEAGYGGILELDASLYY